MCRVKVWSRFCWTFINRGNRTSTWSRIPHHASGNSDASWAISSAKLGRDTFLWVISFYVVEIAHTESQLCQEEDSHCELSSVALWMAGDEVAWRGIKEWEPCVGGTLPIVPGTNWRTFYFFPEQARSQLALCCLPVTRVGPPRA